MKKLCPNEQFMIFQTTPNINDFGPILWLPSVTHIRELGSHLSNFIQFVIEEPFENLNHEDKRA